MSGWAKKVDEQGFDALRETPREGRISKLSHEQYCELDSVIQQDPRNLGYNVWDGNTRGDLIFKKYGISFKIRHCQTIFHKLGFSRIRPQTYPSKNEEHSEEREAFKKMAEIRADENLIAVYQDEVHFQAQTTVTAAWFKKGTDPKGKKHAVVMDNASWHKAAKKAIGSGRLRHPAFYVISDYVVFIDMPPYSPDLNPIEQVWRITRREFTHNRFFKIINVLEGTTDRAFAE